MINLYLHTHYHKTLLGISKWTKSILIMDKIWLDTFCILLFNSIMKLLQCTNSVCQREPFPC